MRMNKSEFRGFAPEGAAGGSEPLSCRFVVAVDEVAAPTEAVTWVLEVTSARAEVGGSRAESPSSSTTSAHTFALGPLKKELPSAGASAVETSVEPPDGGAGPLGPESDGELAIAEAATLEAAEVAALEAVALAQEACDPAPCGGAGPPGPESGGKPTMIGEPGGEVATEVASLEVVVSSHEASEPLPCGDAGHPETGSCGPAGSGIVPNEVWGTQLGEGPHGPESIRGPVEEVVAVEVAVAEASKAAPERGAGLAGPKSGRELAIAEVATREVAEVAALEEA
jgi:hypothetical protein